MDYRFARVAVWSMLINGFGAAPASMYWRPSIVASPYPLGGTVVMKQTIRAFFFRMITTRPLYPDHHGLGHHVSFGSFKQSKTSQGQQRMFRTPG